MVKTRKNSRDTHSKRKEKKDYTHFAINKKNYRSESCHKKRVVGGKPVVSHMGDKRNKVPHNKWLGVVIKKSYYLGDKIGKGKRNKRKKCDSFFLLPRRKNKIYESQKNRHDPKIFCSKYNQRI